LRNRLTLALTTLVAIPVVALGIALPAAAIDSRGAAVSGEKPAPASPLYRSNEPTLTIQPNYDGNTRLSFGTYEWDEALPYYTATVTEVASGRAIPLGFGYASTIGSSYSEVEGPYEVPTAEPLVVGALYEATLNVNTTGHWHCSIYDEDGCSWYEAEESFSRYRFTWSGAKMTGSVYVPPKVATRIGLSPKVKWGPRGWKVTATIFRDKVRGDRLKLVGQWRANGGWRVDDTWRTDDNGKLRIRFKGETKPTRYRFIFKGDDVSLPSRSKVFFITARS
jgi:hypothetical protein